MSGRQSVVPVPRHRSQMGMVLRQLVRNKAAIAGLLVCVMLVGLAILAPIVATQDPLEVAPGDRLRPPDAYHLFGTDGLGRDLFSRVIYGARLSLRVGSMAVGIALVGGLLLGLAAGYYGGSLDQTISLFVDVMLAFPGLLLALLIVATLGTSLENLMLALGLSGIPTYTRVVRSTTIAAKQEAYVDAARVIGCGHRRTIVRHILPNVISPLIVVATLGLGNTIIAAAGLSFLGLGARPPTPEWGAILSEGRYVLHTAWWVTAFPGMAIFISVLAINVLGDGLREALDPRQWR